MTSGDNPENTVLTSTLMSCMQHQRWQSLSVTTESETEPNVLQSPLIGGPLDGLLLDITDWTKDEIDNGAALVAERGRFPGGRTLYAPHPEEPRAPAPGVTCCFHHSGDTPRPPDVRSEP